MRVFLLLSAALLLFRPAFAQNIPHLVPCASISPQAVTIVPAPFNAYMRLSCYPYAEELHPPDGIHWTDGKIDLGLSSMDDRPGPDGKPRFGLTWYVALTPHQITPQHDAELRQVLAPALKPIFIVGARIVELDATTSAGEVKQEFLILPTDPVATHGIKILMECHEFCQGSDEPLILGVIADRAN